MKECTCDLRTRVVGDGCEICNPEKALEYAKETIAYLERELAAYKHVMDILRDSPCKYPPWRDAREVVEWLERRVEVRLAANAGNQRSRSDPLD